MLALLGLFITCPAFGQGVNAPESLLWIRGGGGLFESDGVLTTPNYSTTVFDIGFVRSRSIFNQYLGFEYGARVGFKAKRDSYYFGPDNNASDVLGVDAFIDMTVSDAGLFYIGAPLLLSVGIKQTELNAGTELRFWMDSRRHLINQIKGRPDIGITLGLNQKLGNRFVIGLEGILGTIPVIKSSSGGNYDYNYYNRELKVGVGYRFAN